MSATDAAKERAAKLNAMLAAQGKLAKSNPPPVVVKHLFVCKKSVQYNCFNAGNNKEPLKVWEICRGSVVTVSFLYKSEGIFLFGLPPRFNPQKLEQFERLKIS